MKGIQGLIVAIVLGILGACVNMYYLYKGRKIETQTFVGIREGVTVLSGKTIKGEHLTRVDIPVEHVGNLKTYAYLYSDLGTIVGRKAVRDYSGRGGELLMREDLRTPPPQLTLKQDEAAVGVPVDTSATITSQIIPGVTPVSFYLPKSRGRVAGATSPGAEEVWEWAGPFEVLAVGNRMGTSALMKAEKISPQQRHILTLRARFQNGEMDPKIADLYDYVHRTQNAPLRLMIHPPTPEPGES